MNHHRTPTVTRSEVTTRLADLEDVAQVEAMHERCSDISLCNRFHAPLPRIGTSLVRQLVAPSGGWGAVAEYAGSVVAFASAGPVSASEVEVGLLVEDAHQQHGIGTRMLHETATEAAARGYRTLQLLTRPENGRVLGTVQAAGLVVRASSQDGLLAITASLRRTGSPGPGLARPA